MSDVNEDATPTRPFRKLSDFRLGKEVGQGSFSTVYVVRELATGVDFAMKVVDKQHVIRNRAVESVLMEKAVLTRTNHVFIVRLHYTFQDSTCLYYVLEYARRGELLQELNRLTCFDVPCAQFYAAEILAALNYLHEQSIVHRDVKPENVLLTDKMHIKLCDFGSAMILNDPNVKAPSFTGTPEYVSPEMLSIRSHYGENSPSGDSHSPEQLAYLMDYWALGCVIYQFISGRSPFRAERDTHAYEAFGRVLNLSYSFMDGFDPDAKDLVQKLLVRLPIERYGSPKHGGPEAVRSHPFFAGIDWHRLASQDPPRLVPNMEPVIPQTNSTSSHSTEAVQFPETMVAQLTDVERTRLFSLQEKNNPFHRFARNRLILKQGILYKRRGLFARKRMFLLSEGPHLFYVDMESMSVKGEVPFSSFMSLELRSDRLFFIHVPKRTYYLEDSAGTASSWVEHIKAVQQFYYTDTAPEQQQQQVTGDTH